MGYIYCLTSPSGKKYIGQTTRSVEKRVSEHASLSGTCIILERAIQKYGIDSFTVETLAEVENTSLNETEIELIGKYNTMEPNGYNIRSGGSSGKHSEASKQRMRESKLGDRNHNFGKPRTTKTRDKISQAKCGENHHFFGKELTYEHKLALSKSHKDDNLPMYLVHVKERPKMYQGAGYAVINHPILKTKYFTSKKLTLEEKLKIATEYLNSCDMDAVQRLNGDGLLNEQPSS